MESLLDRPEAAVSPGLGEAFWVTTPLPGEPSGGAHSSVVLSSAAYNATTGFPVIAALRRQPETAYRIQVGVSQFTPAPGQPPLDTPRIIGLDQCRGASTAELVSKHGDVNLGCVQAVIAKVPTQFQLGSDTYARRGERWRLSQPIDGISEVVVVLNDRAVQTAAMTQVLALPAGQPVQAAPLLMVRKSQLMTLLGRLTASEQAELDRFIRFIFDL
jgi:mRNA-degrading endonuclease toxin of MazEF toxin-antitoxin module